MSHRHSRPVDEPATINAAVISHHLEEAGRPQMAAFVRRLGQWAQDANLQAAAAKRAHDEVLARLRVYEPEEKVETCSGGVWTGD